jgi:hypothetical protein
LKKKKNQKKEKKRGRKKGENFLKEKESRDNNLSVDFIFPKKEGEKKLEIIIPMFEFIFSIKGEKRRMKGKGGKTK